LADLHLHLSGIAGQLQSLWQAVRDLPPAQLLLIAQAVPTSPRAT